jgi:hypothetical protein
MSVTQVSHENHRTTTPTTLLKRLDRNRTAGRRTQGRLNHYALGVNTLIARRTPTRPTVYLRTEVEVNGIKWALKLYLASDNRARVKIGCQDATIAEWLGWGKEDVILRHAGYDGAVIDRFYIGLLALALQARALWPRANWTD